jgi:putative transposase
MDDNYRTPLIVAAMAMTVRNPRPESRGIFHSDRGSNYTSAEFAEALSELGIRQSVGRTVICYDNAMAELFFAALKTSGCTVHNILPGKTPWRILRGT